MNIGLMIIELEEEHLRDNQVGTVVVDHSLQKDDPVLKEPAVDVKNTLFAAAPLDHVRNQGHGKFLRAARPQVKKSAAGDWGDKEKSNRVNAFRSFLLRPSAARHLALQTTWIPDH